MHKVELGRDLAPPFVSSSLPYMVLHRLVHHEAHCAVSGYKVLARLDVLTYDAGSGVKRVNDAIK